MNKLVQIRKYLGITQSQLADILRVKQNTISLIENDKILLIDRNKQVLIEKLGVNPAWLNNGEGDIFIGRSNPTIPSSLPENLDETQRKIIEYGNAPAAAKPKNKIFEINQSDNSAKGIPFYAKPVTGSLLESHSDMDSLEAEYFINIEPLNDCSFYRPIYGESMSPRYNPGDIVACQRVYSKDIIMYGEAYLCMIKNGADYYETVKILRRSDSPELITLKSINPEFDDTTIPLDNIIQLYIIRGKIERNI